MPARSADPVSTLARHITQYSLAAAVAGVGVMALASPVQGEVVFTKKTIPIPVSDLGVEGVGISLANNGVDDLKLTLSSFEVFGNFGMRLNAVNAAAGRGVVGANSFGNFKYGSALARGAKIGPSANFVSAACGGSYFSCADAVGLAESHISTSRVVSGKWSGDVKNRYLGVRFRMNGETHYGWVRLTVNTNVELKISATVTGYAYETVANKAILAGTAAGSGAASDGKPVAQFHNSADIQNRNAPSLGMLAAGAEALPIWRRKEAVASN